MRSWEYFHNAFQKYFEKPSAIADGFFYQRLKQNKSPEHILKLLQENNH
jgi:hypothetical protein